MATDKLVTTFTEETSSTLNGNEQFVMFDSIEGKRALLSVISDYVVQNGEISGDERVLVPQANVTLESKVIDAGVWWEVLDDCEGWKLQKNILFRHCRILNPNRVRVAWGSETTMRDSFAKISRTLKRKEMRK